MNRWEIILGPNTNQWWVYDNERDCYIDPPTEILDKIDDLEYMAQERFLEDEVSKNPDWLYDEDYCYYDEDFEI